MDEFEWKNPPNESFQQEKRRALDFAKMYEPFDWTKLLDQ